jgi:hypothetical protein
LVFDNKENIRSSSGNVSERGLPLFNFPKEVVEDLKARTLVVMERAQRDEYMASVENLEKMKRKKFLISKQYKDFANLNLSFYTRYATIEESCFGDPLEEEPNIAYSIL